jgi:1D-myo-inositol-triphosphate 3-kinase
MIDFGKTRRLPDGIQITHDTPWQRHSHEDGYLIGLDHLIRMFEQMMSD